MKRNSIFNLIDKIIQVLRYTKNFALDKLQYFPKYFRFYLDFNFIKKTIPLKCSWQDRYPILNEATTTTSFDRHYILHTSWALRKVKEYQPDLHIDLSSSLYFCTALSAFIPVKFYDYRPPQISLSNLSTDFIDLISLSFKDESINSLSCMHVIEHIGLGRYGDSLDSFGDRKAIKELIRVLKPGGFLLFVVPLGKPKVCFNAHRIYSYEMIKNFFDTLLLHELYFIPDKGECILNPDVRIIEQQNYGCGCFMFQKPKKRDDSHEN